MTDQGISGFESNLYIHIQVQTVSLEELKRMRIINCSGRDRLLPLKVLGNGSLSSPLLVKAAGFSTSAKSAIKMVGGKTELIK
jgi:large subunit ribosomal protein L15